MFSTRLARWPPSEVVEAPLQVRGSSFTRTLWGWWEGEAAARVLWQSTSRHAEKQYFDQGQVRLFPIALVAPFFAATTSLAGPISTVFVRSHLLPLEEPRHQPF